MLKKIRLGYYYNGNRHDDDLLNIYEVYYKKSPQNIYASLIGDDVIKDKKFVNKLSKIENALYSVILDEIIGTDLEKITECTYMSEESIDWSKREPSEVMVGLKIYIRNEFLILARAQNIQVYDRCTAGYKLQKEISYEAFTTIKEIIDELLLR